MPPKPQQIFVERWLPYGEQRQRVIYEPAKPICQIPDPKNVVIQWDAPDVEVRREVKNLGVQPADPQDYLRRHGHHLVRSDQLPEIAVRYAQAQGIQLAANSQAHQGVVVEGDVQALSLIDLEAHGLGYLRGRLSQSVSNLSSLGGQQSQSLYQSYDSGLSQSYANFNHADASAAAAVTPSNGYSHQNLSSAYSAEQVHFGGGGDVSAAHAHAHTHAHAHAHGSAASAISSAAVADYNAIPPGAYPCDELPPQQQSNVQFPC